MKHAAWVIFAGVIGILAALITAELVEERHEQREWVNGRGVSF